MDIEALLTDANLEATDELEDAYDDVFEEPESDTNQNETEIGKKKPSTLDVLKAATETVAVEEKRAADKLFNETSDSLKREIPKLRSSKDAEDILVEASKEVNEFYNETADEEEAEKYAEEPPAEEEEKKMDPVQEVEEESEDDEEEEDEDDDDEDRRNQSQQLLFACYNRKNQAVMAALRKGADYFVRDRHGWTPLIWAAAKGYDDIIEVLLEHVRGRGKSLKRYVNAQDNITGWTALHAACVGGHIDAVEMLLRNKAKKSIVNFMKEKPVDCIGKSKNARDIREMLSQQRMRQ